MTESLCSVEMFGVGIPTAFEDIESSPIDVFFACGVVNPLGPTLTVLGAVGNAKPGQALPLVRVTLNPFLQEIVQIGRFNVGDSWEPVNLFQPLVSLTGGSCPTLVVVNAKPDETKRIQIYECILRHFPDDVVRICGEVEAHFGDPWTRITRSIAGAHQPVDMSVESAIQRLRPLLMQQAHIKNELQAFIAAWNGSIEHSGVSEDIKRGACTTERIQNFVFQRILPAVWLPEIPDEIAEIAGTTNEVSSQEPFVAESISQVREVLRSGRWREFDKQNLLSLLESSIILYGSEVDIEDIPFVGQLYASVVHAGVDVDSRLTIEGRILGLVEKKQISVVALLPFLIQDPDQAVVSKTTIDFVCASHYSGDELYAVRELRPLLKKRTLENRAAAFGALVAMGETELLPLIAELRPELSSDEIANAAMVHTEFLQHRAIQFWLSWAKELGGREDAESLGNFGSCASALVTCLRHVRIDSVFDGKRNFPLASSENPITILQKWSLSDYADRLAQDFYDLEGLERTPKLFSHVLRAWGLRPRAPLEQQFIPDDISPEDGFRSLRDPEAER